MPRTVLYDLANERSAGTEVSKTEKHIIGEHESGWVFTKEVPLEESPSTVTIAGFTEVTDGTPAAGEFDVAYDVATPESRGGAIKFNATNDGTEVTIVYKGRGSIISAGMMNDVQHITGKWNINLRKAKADTPDDEFDGAALDPKWTAVNGTSGTVNLLGTTGGIYEARPEESRLLAQLANGANVNLRQAYTLPDGQSLIVKLWPAFTWDVDDTTSSALLLLLALNDSTTVVQPGSGVSFHVGVQTIDDAAGDGLRVLFRNDAGAATIASTNRAGQGGGPYYLRLARSTLTYYAFFSRTGDVWVPLKSLTAASAPAQLWLSLSSAAAMSNPQPIIAVDWLRLGGNGVFPW